MKLSEPLQKVYDIIKNFNRPVINEEITPLYDSRDGVRVYNGTIADYLAQLIKLDLIESDYVVIDGVKKKHKNYWIKQKKRGYIPYKVKNPACGDCCLYYQYASDGKRCPNLKKDNKCKYNLKPLRKLR